MLKRVWRIGLLVLLLGLVAGIFSVIAQQPPCGETCPPPPSEKPPPGFISILVIVNVAGAPECDIAKKPIEGAKVTLLSKAERVYKDKVLAEGFTNKEGKFAAWIIIFGKNPEEARQNLEVGVEKKGFELKSIFSFTMTIPFFGTFISANVCLQAAPIRSVWIWTLERLPEEYQKNECLQEALKLAEAIAKSKKGQDAFKKVNKEGVKLEDELKDGEGPEIEVEELDEAWGEYRGDAGGKEDAIYIDKSKLDKLLDLCKVKAKKKDAIIRIASTILHETAHWKDDNKKFPKDDSKKPQHEDIDTHGEEGTQLEVDIFGGDLDMNGLDAKGDPTENSKLTKDRKEVDDETKKQWADPNWWKKQ